jgi:hypothetical protein
MSSLSRIIGHTTGEFAEKRQVGYYQVWSINYNQLLNRADMQMDDLASPWRIECFSEGSMKCVVGACCGELEYVRDPVTATDKVVNIDGLEVSVARPEFFVVNKCSDLQWEQEHNPTVRREPDRTGSEVTLDGIWVPIYCTESDWR